MGKQLEDMMAEGQEVDVKIPEESPQAEQQPLVSMDGSQSEGLLAAQRHNLLGDGPYPIKKYKVGAGQLTALVMHATNGYQDSWLAQDEIDGLGCLLGFHVTGARMHRHPPIMTVTDGRGGLRRCALTPTK